MGQPDELLNRRSIITLAAQGFPVTSENASILVNYIADFEAANLAKLPRLLTISSFGWKCYNGSCFFVLGDNAIGTDLEVNFVAEGDGERNFAKALKTKGCYKEWLKIIRRAIQYPRVCFALYSSFAPPLLPILDLYSFSIDFCGESSIGRQPPSWFPPVPMAIL